MPEGYEGARHLSQLLWRSEKGASPMYKSLNCLLSLMCPSFDVARTVLRFQGIKANVDRVRGLSLSLASSAMENRVEVQLEEQETMAGKKVIVDGRGQRNTKKKNSQSENRNLIPLGENRRCSSSPRWMIKVN